MIHRVIPLSHLTRATWYAPHDDPHVRRLSQMLDMHQVLALGNRWKKFGLGMLCLDNALEEELERIAINYKSICTRVSKSFYQTLRPSTPRSGTLTGYTVEVRAQSPVRMVGTAPSRRNVEPGCKAGCLWSRASQVRLFFFFQLLVSFGELSSL